MQASCAPASAAPANGPFSPQERAMQEELHQLRAAKAHLEQLLRVERAFQQAEFAKHDAEVEEMEMQLHVARASAQLAQQQHAQALEQQRQLHQQALAAAHQGRQDALRSLQQMASVLSAATQRADAARALAAAAQADALSAQQERNMLVARVAEAEVSMATNADGTPSHPPHHARGTQLPPPRQQPNEQDGREAPSGSAAQGLDTHPAPQQQAARPDVHVQPLARDEAQTWQAVDPVTPHVAAPVQPSSTCAAAPARHDATAPSHPPSLPPSRSHAPGQPTPSQPRPPPNLPPPPPLTKLPFPLPRARLDERANGSCRECNRTHSGVPCREAYPWTVSAGFADSTWRIYRERHPDTPAARFGEAFMWERKSQHVQLLGPRRGQLLAFEWEEDDDERQQQDGGGGRQPEQHPRNRSLRSASHAASLYEEHDSERGGRAVGAGPHAVSGVGSHAHGIVLHHLQPWKPPGWEPPAPSGELPFPLPPPTLNEDECGACNFCRGWHPHKPCLARFPWWAVNPRLSAEVWAMHRKLFPHEPTATHPEFRVQLGDSNRVTVVSRQSGGRMTVLAVPQRQQQPAQDGGGAAALGERAPRQRGRRSPSPEEEPRSGGAGGGSRGTATALGGRMRGRSHSREREGKEERGRRKERRSRSRSRSPRQGRRRRVEGGGAEGAAGEAPVACSVPPYRLLQDNAAAGAGRGLVSWDGVAVLESYPPFVLLDRA